MTKEEIIKEAYKNHYWLYSECDNAGDGYIFMTEGLDFHSIWEEIPLDKHPYLSRAYRPSSLRGIENNNGWIKVESESDIKVFNEEMWIKHNDGDILTIYATKSYLLKNCTHYQRIITPKPPIY